MATLHIEHSITDIDTWLTAFRRFDEARRRAGVTDIRVWQPTDDPHHILVNLEFGSVEAAEKFRRFLTDAVWNSPQHSPALAGTPTARVLAEVSV